jgi:hypothetical protein
VTARAGTGGTISPSSALVDSGNTTAFTVTPKIGYIVSGVTGCGGSLSGIVTASFAAAFTWVSGSNTPNSTGLRYARRSCARQPARRTTRSAHVDG